MKMKKHNWVILGIAMVLVYVGYWTWKSNISRELVIVNGVEYELLGVKSVTPDLGENVESFDTYLLTLAYDEPDGGRKAGTIMVPKSGIIRDFKLKENSVTWDPPITLQGKTYAIARWNPKRILSDDPTPGIRPGPPLTRDVN